MNEEIDHKKICIITKKRLTVHHNDEEVLSFFYFAFSAVCM